MKVHDLITKLQSMPQEKEVVCNPRGDCWSLLDDMDADSVRIENVVRERYFGKDMWTTDHDGILGVDVVVIGTC